MCERGRRGGGGGCGREKRKHHGNVIQTLQNLSKPFIFGQPQSATRTAVHKEKKNGKLQANYNIRWHGNWTKCPNASNTNSRERGRCGQLRGFHPVYIHILYNKHFAFLFLVSSWSYHICLRAQRNEHHIWQDEALVAAFQKQVSIINCRERSITRQFLAVPKPALHFPDDNGQSFHFLAA